MARDIWIVDNGSSHRGERAAEELRARHPRVVIVHTPVHASWLNQIEIYFSIIQRKGAYSERLRHAGRACRPNPGLRSTLLSARQTLRLAFHAPGSRAALE